MSTNVKPKKLGFGKGLILIAAILIVLHWVSDGKSTEFIKDIFRDTTDSTGTTAAPTTPPQAERLPSVPEELWDHVYLDTRGQGSCARFTGNVTVLFVCYYISSILVEFILPSFYARESWIMWIVYAVLVVGIFSLVSFFLMNICISGLRSFTKRVFKRL